MKLLFCDKCCDIFKLDEEPRKCKCGEVTGRYLDNRYAVTNGKGFSIAIGNGSLMNAIIKMVKLELDHDDNDRQDFIKNCKISHAWLRPNSGPGNPHITVMED